MREGGEIALDLADGVIAGEDPIPFLVVAPEWIALAEFEEFLKRILFENRAVLQIEFRCGVEAYLVHGPVLA